MKRAIAISALLVAGTSLAGAAPAAVGTATVTLTESSPYAVVSGTTLYYSANSGSFTVTATDSDPASIDTVDFPAITGMTGDGTVGDAPWQTTYSFTSSTTATGAQTVTVTDLDTSSDTATFTVTPDTAPTVANSTPTEVSGTGDQYWSSSANTLWFRPAGAGSFTLNATADDDETGVAQVAFPDVSGTSGWGGSTGGTDTAAPFASSTYTWTAGAAAPGAKTVTATNGTGMTGTATVTISADSTGPSGQSVALSGGPWFTSASVPLTITAGTDAGAGVDSTRGIVERAGAPLTNGVCGTFGSFAAVTLSGGADTTAASGNCYRYQYKATDNVGNVSAASAASNDAKVDTTPPTTPSLLVSGTPSAGASGTTVYYRPGTASTFTITAASSDPESGIASYSFPAIAGFTPIGSGSSRTYTATVAPATAPPAVSVTASNGAGRASPSATFTLVPDATAPTLTLRCNGGPCSTRPYAKAVTVSLAATDTGSGVATILYTTDGSAPTEDNGSEYTRPFALSTTTRLRVVAYDRAGNPSTPLSRTISSLASRLAFTAPARVTVAKKAKLLKARVHASLHARGSATISGKRLKKPRTWRFLLPAGTSTVQIRLPAALKRPGAYRLAWVVTHGRTTVRRVSRVTLR